MQIAPHYSETYTKLANLLAIGSVIYLHQQLIVAAEPLALRPLASLTSSVLQANAEDAFAETYVPVPHLKESSSLP